ncbi:hypothetical protein GSY69_02280 [Brevibacterium sp. 5221]|uniref:Uncharacterized protein n=1 Tax=Brevibacterium rongguiense TaxID=2695267 RepID=A0A6N9H443_9MICO|nr:MULTISPECIES: hypothetical protein [Brevibacterium]MYM18837.1 hypothetical protein [Brevibacterium rongguiense]WAL39906.1 hypothetical protein BRM1_11735 [Brevibacterium sp. BRM-1]
MVFAFAFTALLVLTGLCTSAVVGLRRQRRFLASRADAVDGDGASVGGSGAEAGPAAAGAALPEGLAAEGGPMRAAGTAA